MTLSQEILSQFEAWLAAAREAGEIEPTAMTLATAEPASGRVSARLVLMKQVDNRGLVFYTNTTSLKGQQLATHPTAALNFYWKKLERQVRLEGIVRPVKSAEADAYFAARGRGSQLGAWASQQSQTLTGGPQELAAAVRLAEQQYFGQPVPRPPHWSGYRLSPVLVEFWQGRPDRLHQRQLYDWRDGAWHQRWLQP